MNYAHDIYPLLLLAATGLVVSFFMLSALVVGNWREINDKSELADGTPLPRTWKSLPCAMITVGATILSVIVLLALLNANPIPA